MKIYPMSMHPEVRDDENKAGRRGRFHFRPWKIKAAMKLRVEAAFRLWFALTYLETSLQCSKRSWHTIRRSFK